VLVTTSCAPATFTRRIRVRARPSHVDRRKGFANRTAGRHACSTRPACSAGRSRRHLRSWPCRESTPAVPWHFSTSGWPRGCPCDDVLNLRALDVDNRRLAGDRNRLLQGTDFQSTLTRRRTCRSTRCPRLDRAESRRPECHRCVPGRRSTIRYWPVASVTALRTRSMSDGLAASTVTPGSTPRRVPDDAGDGCLSVKRGGRRTTRVTGDEGPKHTAHEASWTPS
jgi:hypothetical protein